MKVVLGLLCIVALNAAVADDEIVPLSGDISGKTILFMPGKPRKGDTLMDSIYDESKALLAGNIEVLKSFAVVKVALAGVADSLECSGKRCIELSQRRVNLVRRWLLSHGVPESSIVRTEVLGLERPLVDGSKSNERMLNRRVEFNFTL